MKTALDAGHGASRGHTFTGAAANGLVEDEVVLDIVKRIGHHLRAAGHNTVETRKSDRLIPLSARGKLAWLQRCGFFLSIHCNAGPNSASGVEAYVANNDMRSRKIAARLVEAISKHGLPNRGAKWDSQSQYLRLRVLRDTYKYMPAILLEIGFLTNNHDSLLLKDSKLREAVAVTIAREIANT